MAVTKTKKSYEKSKQTEVFTTDFVCMVLQENGLIDVQALAQIKRREQEQFRLLKTRHKNNGHTQITPVDVISSLKFRSVSDPEIVVTEEVIMKALAVYWKLPFLKIEMSKLQCSGIIAKLSEPFARKHLIAPILISKTMLLVAIINPWDVEALDTIKQTTKLKVRPVVSTKADILKAIERCYEKKKAKEVQEKQRNEFRTFVNAAKKELLQDSQIEIDDTGQYSEKYVVNAVNSLLHCAFEQHSSDIHIEPKSSYSTIRLRTDGVLREFERIPQEIHNSFVVRIKALAGMKIAEKRKPQDGHFRANFQDKDIEFRISTMPVAFGEKVMLRVLDPTMLLQRIDVLGFSEEELAQYKSLVSKSSGMLLVTGPTGSGKTTTIYSTLNTLAEGEINITTIEDPIELIHDKFNQITVQPNIGLTFGTAIRHIVRQSPDVIMVGEIRDDETVGHAFQAALTGRLVISTLHTNNAASTIVRLADMGARPSLLESSLIAVVSQQLVRKVCDYCREPYTLSQNEMQALGLSEENVEEFSLQKGRGCSRCGGTGYSGRTAIFEIMKITDGLRTLIHNNAAAHQIEDLAIKEGMRTLKDSAIAKLKAGMTTSEEVLRIMGETI